MQARSGLTLSCPTLLFSDVSVLFQGDFFATGGTAPYIITKIGGVYPPFTSSPFAINGNVISGTPSGTGSFTATYQVLDSLGATAQTSCTIVVNSFPTLQCPTPTGVSGTNGYGGSVSTNGGSGSFYMVISAGAVPTGLIMTNSGSFRFVFSISLILCKLSRLCITSGTCDAAGSFTFTVSAQDQAKGTPTISCTITVTGLAFGCPKSPYASGSSYSSTRVATGGTAPYTVCGLNGFLSYIIINCVIF
jgi:hypothetical protein